MCAANARATANAQIIGRASTINVSIHASVNAARMLFALLVGIWPHANVQMDGKVMLSCHVAKRDRSQSQDITKSRPLMERSTVAAFSIKKFNGVYNFDEIHEKRKKR